MRKSFQPRKSPNICFIPNDKNYLTVAVHVRRGGGYDAPGAFINWPLRFPPDSYYLESLRRLCALFPDRPIYAHIFTDDVNPKAIKLKYQNALKDLPISFGCREYGNRYNVNVMDDFFSMMKFDCLIRSCSNFTLIPSIIADYKVIMSPKKNSLVPIEPNNAKCSYGICIENHIDEIDVDIAAD